MSHAKNVRSTDAEITEQIRAQVGQNPDIEKIAVKNRLLQLHVTDGLYRKLAVDRERGKKIVLTLMQQMKQLTGETDVTVWIFCRNEKLIEGRVKEWGGDNVNYYCDL